MYPLGRVIFAPRASDNVVSPKNLASCWPTALDLILVGSIVTILSANLGLICIPLICKLAFAALGTNFSS